MDIQAGQVSLHPGAAPVNMKINGQARWDSGRLDIHHLDAQAGSTRLTCKRVFRIQRTTPSTAELTCQSDNLASSLSPLGIRGAAGNFRAQASLSGTSLHPECSLKFKGSGLGFRDIQIGALELDADLEPSGILRISALSLKNQESELTAKGRIPVFSESGHGFCRDFCIYRGISSGCTREFSAILPHSRLY